MKLQESLKCGAGIRGEKCRNKIKKFEGNTLPKPSMAFLRVSHASSQLKSQFG